MTLYGCPARFELRRKRSAKYDGIQQKFAKLSDILHRILLLNQRFYIAFYVRLATNLLH